MPERYCPRMMTTKLRPISTCHTPPKDKKAFAKKLGADLVKHRGKKRFYSIAEVHASLCRLQWLDLDCWGFALYSSRHDFDRHHRGIGEQCDYDSMRGEMIDALADGASWSLLDIDLSWLEWPDIDLSVIFDFIDIG
jgi:hypothetical protein